MKAPFFAFGSLIELGRGCKFKLLDYYKAKISFTLLALFKNSDL